MLIKYKNNSCSQEKQKFSSIQKKKKTQSNMEISHLLVLIFHAIIVLPDGNIYSMWISSKQINRELLQTLFLHGILNRTL